MTAPSHVEVLEEEVAKAIYEAHASTYTTLRLPEWEELGGMVGDATVEHWRKIARAAIALMRAPVGDGYYLATFKHKDNSGAVMWWGPNDAGYTPDLETAGVYTSLTDGYHVNEYTIPVPVRFIEGLRVRRTIDPGDSLNRAFWSPNHLREAIAAMHRKETP